MIEVNEESVIFFPSDYLDDHGILKRPSLVSLIRVIKLRLE